PSLPDSAWAFDHMHRLPRPERFTNETPRDIIVKCHYYVHKEALMAAARKTATIPEPHQRISLYADLSAATMTRRKEFANETATLRATNVTYKWGYPIKQ
ncbi:Hypothetical predicted protein, partial [Pelobates cultripes]